MYNNNKQKDNIMQTLITISEQSLLVGSSIVMATVMVISYLIIGKKTK